MTSSHTAPLFTNNHRFSFRYWFFLTFSLLLISTLALLPSFSAHATTPRQEISVDANNTDNGEISWTVAPADSDGPDGRISFRHELEPGESTSDQLSITNLGQSDASFDVRTGDGMIGTNGAFDIAAGTPTASGSWVKVDGMSGVQLLVPAGEQVIVPISVTVPANATPGDHPAGIVVSPTLNAGEVNVTHRIGVRVHLRVAGQVAPKLEISELTTNFTPSWVPFMPGVLQLNYTVQNNGNVRLGSANQAEIAGIFWLGNTVGASAIDELLPGDAVAVTQEIEVWPLVFIWGELTASGFAVGADIVPAVDASSTAISTFAVSWTGLIVVLLIAAALIWWRLRRRRDADAAPNSETEPETEPETDPLAATEKPQPVPELV